MSWNRVSPCVLFVILLGLGIVRGENPFTPLTQSDTALDPYAPPGPAQPAEPPGVLSSWITYVRPGCCGPVGGSGPIGTELYLRTGPSIPVEGGFLKHTLSVGWEEQGGGRALFFNQEQDAAWIVDLSLSNIYNHGQHSDKFARLDNVLVPNSVGTATRVPRVNVTVASLNRTLFNYGVGRDWYLFGGNGNCGCDGADKGAAWKVGFDGGGRWGSAKIELHELKHRTDVITAAYAALHTDVEIPWKCCIWTFGLRLEWDYTWMQILQGRNDTHLQDANFLVNFGVRF